MAILVGLLAAAILVISGTAFSASPALAATTSSPAAARFATEASGYQNKVLDAVMLKTPGATRVSADAVELDGGRIILGVTAPGAVHGASPSFTVFAPPLMRSLNSTVARPGSR